MSTKTKARKSVTITITIALILFSCNTWDEYKIRYRDSLRQVEIENVERMRVCRKPQNGYKVYQCPECGMKKYVPFTCKSRLCTLYGTKAANQWAEQIHHKLLKVPHRHVVFTIPDTLREILLFPGTVYSHRVHRENNNALCSLCLIFFAMIYISYLIRIN